ncbi:hypothetical protein HS1_000627 [Candidatus Desulfofervidus auxilii]|uniref:Uncharacterized protein n=1 Tax=Desulfofervidus auxilii TaxID=1621989 RepID=A0A7U4QJC2_DESA2|nr:hypothetical protein [Candidatus Desulfofervidus auxilii]AMM40433.1 hypothetical protein HS1_000627 [Candidatus Desulfofervidus auxilii]
MPKEIYIGFSSHRLEAIPSYERVFNQTDFIILEDAPCPLFPLMLKGEISPEEYSQKFETDFPKFIQAQFRLLQKAYQDRKEIIQIDPYMEKVIQIYQLLEKGKKGQEISHLPEFREIYTAEHNATGCLLDYYQATMGTFEQAVEAIKAFARADAQRIALRDKMRAEKIAQYLQNKRGRVFVEAGYIHLFLSSFLRKSMPPDWKLKASFLLASVSRQIAKSIIGKPLPYPLVPGDILTFWYIGKKKINPEKERLFAAQVLIYNQLITTEELEPTPEVPYPHLKQEFEIKSILKKLSYLDCSRLYPLIKFLPPGKSWALVKKFICVRKNSD